MALRSLIILALLGLTLSACQARHGVYHTVQKGQTLYRISQDYGVDEKYLARINGIDDPTSLQVGKVLFIPGADQPLEVPSTVGMAPSPPDPPRVVAAPPSSPLPAPPARIAPATPSPLPPSKPQAAPRPDPPPRAAPAPSVASRPSPSRAPVKGKFEWPLRGTILKCFSEKSSDPCKGLEISASRGSAVKAAASGSVIYSGDGIRGYGNLIILKHDDSFFTVYGYNDRNLVSSGTFVSKGEKIALSGAPPGGGQPRLHFEIRQGKQSVDPTFYLP